MKKKKTSKISKQTIIISIVVLVAILTPPVIYFINKQDKADVLSWYNSSWNYKKSITVENTSGSTLINEDVLVTINTSDLISQGKLQNDCNDLRFVDSDDTTILDYWIEGGCNTGTTQVWVRIPSLPDGGKTIYMYYDNSGATAGEVSWTGNFISLSDQSSCGSGWSQFSALNGRFPMGSTTYGSTGGTATHSHDGASVTTGTAASNYVYNGYNVNMAPRHGHNVTATLTSNVNHMPQYTNMLYCSKSKVESLSNNIALFDVASVTGWTQYSTLDNRFPLGATSSIGATGGNTTHTHTASWSISSVSNDGQCQSGSTGVTAGHGHSVSSSSVTSANNTPAYLSMVYMKKSSASTLTSERPIYILNTSTMPLGWERFAVLDNRFPIGSISYGGTGGSNTHTHSTSMQTNWQGNTGSCLGGSTKRASAGHSHTAGFTSSEESNLPPYLTVVFAKRKDSQITTLGSEIAQNATPTAPTNLLTEGQTNPTYITDTTPEFSAIYNDPDINDTSNYYQIQVNTTSTFDGINMWDSGKLLMTSTIQGNRSPDISYNGNSLNDNITYYWRIKFWDAFGAGSPWSSTANFSINSDPTAPTSLLTESANNPNDVLDVTPEFSAIYNDPNTSDQANYYQILVNTSSDFSGTTIWDSTKTSITNINQGDRSPDISYAGSTLQQGTLYYWKIKFWDIAGSESPWSSIANFLTNGPPTATSLSIIGETNPEQIVFDIYFSALYTDPNGNNSSNYEIEINTLSDFTGTVMWDSTKTPITITSGNRSPNIQYNGTALSYNGTTYYTRMRFWDTNDNASNWVTGQFIDTLKSFQLNGLQIDGIQLN